MPGGSTFFNDFDFGLVFLSTYWDLVGTLILVYYLFTWDPKRKMYVDY